jgi:hypothetical protein
MLRKIRNQEDIFDNGECSSEKRKKNERNLK